MYTHRGILDAMSDQPRHHQVLDDLLPQHRALRHQIPQVYQRFVALGDAALTDGALSRKVKELVALAIAVVQGCDGCVASHAQAAVRAGATAQEAAEAIGGHHLDARWTGHHPRCSCLRGILRIR